MPAGIKLIRVEVKTGQRATPGTQSAILEAFKPGTAPPDSGATMGGDGGNSPEAERAVRSGVTSGLY
jgi:penicillin-binding protein 1A